MPPAELEDSAPDTLITRPDTLITRAIGPRGPSARCDRPSPMSFWVPKFDGAFSAHVEAHLARTAAVYEHENGRPCEFDRSALEWLDKFARGFVARQPEQVEVMMTAFGIVVGETVRRAYDGVWCLVQGQLEPDQDLPAVELSGNIYVVPWLKVHGYLEGDNGDSFVGFFDFVSRERLTPRQGPTFLS